MKKSFKILSSLLAPVAVLGTTAVAIPLASCSNSKKDTSEYDVKATFTNNDSSINNGSPISIDFGASTTIKADISITKGGEEQSLDDLIYAWSLTSAADGVTISNETTNTVTITNNNSNSSEASVGLKLTISSPTANFNNKEIGNFTLNCKAQEVEPGENDNLNADTKWNWVGSFELDSLLNKSTYDEAIGTEGVFNNGDNSLMFDTTGKKGEVYCHFAAYDKDTGQAVFVNGINHSSFNMPTVSLVNPEDKKYFNSSYYCYVDSTRVNFPASIFNQSAFTTTPVKITYKVEYSKTDGSDSDTFYFSILMSSEFFS